MTCEHVEEIEPFDPEAYPNRHRLTAAERDMLSNPTPNNYEFFEPLTLGEEFEDATGFRGIRK